MDFGEAPAISEELLKKSVAEQLDQLSTNNHLCFPDPEDIHFNEIQELCLGYNKIEMIENLWDFTSLKKLNLSCNRIRKIQGLDMLTNLTDLKLSFNNIKNIEGLEKLRKLQVLELSNNQISVIENIDALEDLSLFLMLNNRIRDLDNVLQLKKFRKLFTLCLSGNPVSEQENYKVLIAAHMPNLKYLDYNVIDKTTRDEASIIYQDVAQRMKDLQLATQKAEEAQRRQEAELKLHRDAFVESLNGPYLFMSMFQHDPEAETLRCIPGIASLLQTFQHQTVELCVQLFEMGLAEHKRREAEVKSFQSGQEKIYEDSQMKATQMMDKFDDQHYERRAEFQRLSAPDALKVKANQSTEIDRLRKGFMRLELKVTRQLEDNIKKLDQSLSDMVYHFRKTALGIFAQLRDLEDNYYQKVKEIAVATVEKVAKGNLEEDLPREAVKLFTEKDTVMDALATGHDNHLLKINDRETQLVTGVSGWKVNLIKENQDKELKLNHLRNLDTLRLVEYLKERLESWQKQ
ncbi:dynein regulatory complex subunit 3 [Stegastes partitus]|uniref:Dynein regulatory complex subunit 3 n=1 Tax=Stegastes partitus TaxID=144197 RepID=A0A9Y4N788_9TELE|nr:PREDICTED: leucine-rich repeat-containing protein 48 [Stegastes partitus]